MPKIEYGSREKFSCEEVWFLPGTLLSQFFEIPSVLSFAVCFDGTKETLSLSLRPMLIVSVCLHLLRATLFHWRCPVSVESSLSCSSTPATLFYVRGRARSTVTVVWVVRSVRALSPPRPLFLRALLSLLSLYLNSCFAHTGEVTLSLSLALSVCIVMYMFIWNQSEYTVFCY